MFRYPHPRRRRLPAHLDLPPQHSYNNMIWPLILGLLAAHNAHLVQSHMGDSNIARWQQQQVLPTWSAPTHHLSGIVDSHIGSDYSTGDILSHESFPITTELHPHHQQKRGGIHDSEGACQLQRQHCIWQSKSSQGYQHLTSLGHHEGIAEHCNLFYSAFCLCTLDYPLREHSARYGQHQPGWQVSDLYRWAPQQWHQQQSHLQQHPRSPMHNSGVTWYHEQQRQQQQHQLQQACASLHVQHGHQRHYHTRWEHYNSTRCINTNHHIVDCTLYSPNA